MHSGTQIRQMDLGEWSIFWNFYDQSLEYYVGRYGVFYAHVDRFGEEHRHEIRRNFCILTVLRTPLSVIFYD